MYGLSYALHSWSLLLVKIHVSLDRIIIVWDHHYLFHLAAFAKWSSKWHLRGKSCWWQRERERDMHWFYMHTKAHTRSTKDHPNTRTCIYIYNYTYIHNISLNHLFIWDRSMQNTVESWCSLSFWETSPSSEFPFFVPPCDLRPFCASWSWSKL